MAIDGNFELGVIDDARKRSGGGQTVAPSPYLKKSRLIKSFALQ